jgi:hypothetical protein
VGTSLLRNALALVLGVIVGGAINMTIVVLGPNIIPPPTGVDVTDMESIRDSMHLFEPRHFITPFLAHAGGTLTGSVIASIVAASRRSAICYSVGVIFLVGGIAASFMIPAPNWFIVLDLLGAYIPMAWIGIQLGQRIR